MESVTTTFTDGIRDDDVPTTPPPPPTSVTASSSVAARRLIHLSLQVVHVAVRVRHDLRPRRPRRESAPVHDGRVVEGVAEGRSVRANVGVELKGVRWS
eukprot:29215-Pelagococcus_subviridis.AAC.5